MTRMKIVKIIFLDFDGVINNIESRAVARSTEKFSEGGLVLPSEIPTWQREVDYSSLRLLDLACKLCDAKIVLSTSWRNRVHITEFNSWVRNNGCQYLEMIDRTPPWVELANGSAGIRGDEIQSWIDQHKPPEYVILDDECHFRKHQYSRTVICDHNVGYRYSEFIQTLRLFEADESVLTHYDKTLKIPQWINHPLGTKFE